MADAGRFRQAVIDLVNEVAPSSQSYFYALSTHPFPGFPTSSQTTAQWSGSAASQFVIPDYARVDELNDARVRERVIRAATLQRRIVVEDFERRPPSIVFVERAGVRLGLQGRQFNDLGFYLQDPSLQKIWSDYYEDQPLGPLRVFIWEPAIAVPRAAVSGSHAPHRP